MAQESRLAIVIDSRTAEQRAKDLEVVLSELEKSGVAASVTLRDVGDNAKSTGDKSKGAAQSIGEMATALASIVSVGKLWAQIEKTTFAAGRYEQIGIIMEVVGRNAGYSADELGNLQKELESTGISMTQSRQVITQMIQAQMDLSEATQMARLAQDAATIGNMSSSDALQRLVYGVQTAQTEILRNIGIVVNFENAYRALAEELGVTAASLTEQEKMQARVNAVMAQGGAIAGAYEASMENANKQMGSMERHADNLAVKLGEAYQPGFALVIEGMTESLKIAGDNAGILSVALAGVTASAAVATTGVLATTYGLRALRIAMAAVHGHPVAMTLSLIAGGAAAAYVALSDMGGAARIASIDIDELTRSMESLNQEQLAFRQQQAGEKLEYLEEKAAEAARELQGLERDYEALLEMFEAGRGVDAAGLENVNKALVEQRSRLADANQEVEKAKEVLRDLDNAARIAAGGVDALNAALNATDEAGAKYLERLTDRSIVAGLKTQREQLEAMVAAGKLVFSDADLEAAQRAADIIDAATRTNKGGSGKTTDAGAEYIKQLREEIALVGKQTEHERLLANIASGALTFRNDKMRETAELLSKQLDDTQQQIEMEEVLRDLREQQSTTQLQFFRELEAFGQGERVRQLNADLAKVEDRYRSIIDARRNSPLGLSDEELELIRQSLEEELDLVRWFHDRKLELQQDWKLGAIDALVDYADEAANVYQSVGNAVGNAFKGMEDALTEFVTRGKLDFKSLADSIISDMVRIMIQQSITGPLAGAIGGFFGGGVDTSYAPAHGFSRGGYTGDGGKYDPAGIVHKGEGVLNQDEVRRLGGEAGFNALRRAIRAGGHATGGMAGRPTLPPSVGPSAVPSVELNIINQSGQPVAASQPQVRMDDMGRMVIDVMLTDLQRNGRYARQLKGVMA